ncbi:hypothetical protein ENSA7_29250 [Enhygromyxa salina]|uniref:JAB domain-containing protein n=1 Tax=Enhygromyxa salina TaxID=215803 RepID=A0A2S9YQ65_9BACT|nr:hypothetical protein ENSA7_29250 [Enhygromyxa salina]
MGEWHYHTANAPWPSSQDVDQMRVVAAKPAYRCDIRLLAIVCPVKLTFSIKLFAFPGRDPPVELVLQT